MNNLVLVICIATIAIVAYIERDRWLTSPPPTIVYVTPAPILTARPTPTPPQRRLAPEGTFFMVDYVSTRTPRGIVGFERGQTVRFISANKEKGTLVVTDGAYNIEVNPTQLTNDIDLASLARRQDQESQQQLQSVIESQRQVAENMRRQTDIAHARDVAGYRSSAGVGGGSSVLEKAPVQKGVWEPYGYTRSYGSAYYGSPYYYLYR